VISTSDRERLRMLGMADLGAHAQIATGTKLWTVQRKIAKAISYPRAQVAVPSCNASGKTHLAARLALSFFDTFKPGTPCEICQGPCGGSKIITISSKYDHLALNLWGGIRIAYPQMADRVGFDGRLLPGDLKLEGGPQWFIIGQSVEKPEGLQGHHAAHKLIIGDEATAIGDDASLAITRLLSSGDSRLLLIFNPTTAEGFAYEKSVSPGVETIRIRAWDTPAFTGEDMPFGANLITPRFLEELELQGMGPGTFEWETSVEGRFWEASDDALILGPWVKNAYEVQGNEGVRCLGVDLATYGTNENVITYRDGNEIVWQRVYSSMRMDNFWEGPVLQAVAEVEPHYVVYDADGVGAGVIREADMITRAMTRWGGQVMPFRGGLGVGEARFRNVRSMWWWALRRRLEHGELSIRFRDPKLESQLTGIKYTITNTGEIKVERKEDMKKRNMESPDRADSLMYACAMCEDLPATTPPKPVSWASKQGVTDMSERAMWARMGRDLDEGDGGQKKRYEINPVFGCPDDW
jgi:phage terminase large subunit